MPGFSDSAGMAMIIALLVIGVLLLLLETVLPGMIAGIAGFCCLVAAVWMAYVNCGQDVGNWTLIGVLVLLLAGTVLWIRYFPQSPMARPFISHRAIQGTEEKAELLNKTGTAFTNLRPSGTALIDGQRVDVVTEGPMISKGTPVQVVQVEGLRIVVRAA